MAYRRFISTGGGIAQWLAFLLADPADPGLIPGVFKMPVSLKLIDSAAG